MSKIISKNKLQIIQIEGIVSTSGDNSEKFIRELHSIANYVKIIEITKQQKLRKRD